MNAAARALAQGSFASGNIRHLALSAGNLLLGLLLLAVLITAGVVVSVKDMNRRLFSDLQNLQQTRDELTIEHGQLLLEQTTWSTQARIQAIAQEQLQMVIPTAQVIFIDK